MSAPLLPEGGAQNRVLLGVLRKTPAKKLSSHRVEQFFLVEPASPVQIRVQVIELPTAD